MRIVSTVPLPPVKSDICDFRDFDFEEHRWCSGLKTPQGSDLERFASVAVSEI